MKSPDYLRRTDTVLTRTLNRIAPEKGEAWRQSKKKRVLETAIAVPVYIATLPLSAALKAAVFLEDGKEIYFRDNRVGRDLESSVQVTKIRTMHPNSHVPEKYGVAGSTDSEGKYLGNSCDPRVTKVGRRIRPYDLEELPQLFDVIRRRLSLVGIRAIAGIDHERLKIARKDTEDIDVWEAGYQQDNPSLFHLQAAVDKKRKTDVSRRYHFDNFYAKNASLGLDLYIMYQVVKMIFKNRHAA